MIPPVGRRFFPPKLAAVILLGTLAGVACDKIALLAPSESSISLSAGSLVLPLNGSTEIVATVIEQAGTPVHNGTLVRFSTTLGRMEPPEVQTTDGQATSRLVTGGESGVAQVSASSGSARIETPLEITVGAAAAERILLALSPGVLPPEGGTVNVAATVLDSAGNGLPAIPVTFSATAGTLSSTRVITDGEGRAQTSVTTNRTTTVTAAAGGQTAEAELRLAAAPAVSITAPESLIEDQPATFTVTVTREEGGPPIQSVTIDFGDGTSQSLGAVSESATVSHVYRSPGTFKVTATVVDTSGERTSSSIVVSVLEAGALEVELSASDDTPDVGTPVTFTATVVTTDAVIERFRWDFGDGTTRTTQSGTTSHTYTSSGNRTVRVTVTATDGRTGRAVIEVNVQP